MRWMPVTLVALILLILSACYDTVRPGSIVQATVAFIIEEELFLSVEKHDQEELRRNPVRSQIILDAIAAGVTIDEVRNGRLLICQRSCGPRCSQFFTVLAPEGRHLWKGTPVELEAGVESWQGHPGTMSKFRKTLIPPREPEPNGSRPPGGS